MPLSEYKSIIIFCSPAGTTRHVAHVIAHTLKNLGQRPVLIDIGSNDDLQKMGLHIKDLNSGSCLYLGSPVYAYHAIPPILDIISQLPKDTGAYAIPFVTWGAVTSGIALLEMAERFNDQGFKVIGAAKIVAVHSMMWKLDSPLGKGHPDDEDDSIIKNMVEKIDHNIKQNCIKSLPLKRLNYQPDESLEMMKNTNIQSLAKALPKRYFEKELCNGCALCSTICPAHAIECNEYPIQKSGCIFCYNCVRLCPENAFKADFSNIEKHLKNLPKNRSESPLSQIFFQE